MTHAGRILIVEDDDGIRETLTLMLEVEGYQVTSAQHGAEAIDVLDRDGDPFCAILLDLMMPVMNGWEFARKIQDEKRWSSIPIILVTAFSHEAGTIEGVRQIVSKPVDMGELMRSIGGFCA